LKPCNLRNRYGMVCQASNQRVPRCMHDIPIERKRTVPLQESEAYRLRQEMVQVVNSVVPLRSIYPSCTFRQASSFFMLFCFIFCSTQLTSWWFLVWSTSLAPLDDLPSL
jgi:hypothetical protein